MADFNRTVARASLARGASDSSFGSCWTGGRGVETSAVTLLATGDVRSVGDGGLPQPKGAGGHHRGLAQMTQSPAVKRSRLKTALFNVVPCYANWQALRLKVDG